VPIDLTEMIDETNEISNSKSLSHLKKPSLIQSFFNLYDNLPKENLIYISKNQFTIVPISFLAYCNNKRQLQLKRLKLAKTNQSKVLWLCLTLDLEC
jgi:histidinol phosphatase-like PHP family hydrolase